MSGDVVNRAPTRALDRGLQILEAIATHQPATLAEIAAICDLSAATALRILRTLETRNFVSRDEDTRAFWIGVRTFEIGARFLADTRLTETCRLILRRLAGATGHATALAILDGADIIFIDVQEGSAPLRSTPKIAARIPAHATAAGRCLLAARWAGGLEQTIGEAPYRAVTERTQTAHEALRAELTVVRRQGFAIEHGEALPEISSAACPVRDRSGEAVGALMVQAPTALMRLHVEDWRSILHAAASEASQRLGWNDQTGTKSLATLLD